MYKSASWRDLQRAAANKKPAAKSIAQTSIGSGRWNRGKLPKGASKATRKIGQQNTGR